MEHYDKMSTGELYFHLDDVNVRNKLLEYPHHPKFWIEALEKLTAEFKNDSTNTLDYTKKFQGLRTLIQLQTTHAIDKKYYNYNNNIKVHFNNDEFVLTAKSTLYYENSENCHVKNDENKEEIFKTQFKTLNIDCIDVAHYYLNQGYNPIVLNMANNEIPGGGWKHGAGSQEENIFRRSNYLISLTEYNNYDNNRKWKYPIQEYGCIYSPNVIVFRSNESNGYKYLLQPYRLTFIASGMYRNLNIINDNNVNKLSNNDEIKIMNKIRTILRISYYHGHDCLILSSWGCGAFRNPPNVIAKLFFDVFNESEFYNKFSLVCFAILEDHNTRKAHNPEGNFIPFANIFGSGKL